MELSELDGDEVRSVIGLCAQDAHVFNSTIGENVRLGRGTATDDEIIDVLTKGGTGRLRQCTPGWRLTQPLVSTATG